MNQEKGDLNKAVVEKYKDVYQLELLTDNTEKQSHSIGP